MAPRQLSANPSTCGGAAGRVERYRFKSRWRSDKIFC